MPLGSKCNLDSALADFFLVGNSGISSFLMIFWMVFTLYLMCVFTSVPCFSSNSLFFELVESVNQPVGKNDLSTSRCEVTSEWWGLSIPKWCLYIYIYNMYIYIICIYIYIYYVYIYTHMQLWMISLPVYLFQDTFLMIYEQKLFSWVNIL